MALTFEIPDIKLEAKWIEKIANIIIPWRIYSIINRRAQTMTDERSIPERMGIPHHEFRLAFGGTTIEYDLDKEDTNRNKHGYSLLSAVHLLERLLLPFETSVPHAISDPFLEKGNDGREEIRHEHMSIDDSGKVVFMVTTMRPDEIVRVISFRRASEQERAIFRGLTGYIEP